MIPAIGRAKTTGAEMETVPQGTPALPPTPPEGAPTSPAGVNALADARAEARSWYLDNRCGRQRSLPGAPDGDGGQDDDHRAHAPSITTTLRKKGTLSASS